MAARNKLYPGRRTSKASASPQAIVAGNRTPLVGYLGLTGSYVNPGYRSMLAWWLGGAASFEGGIIPPEPPTEPGGGGGGGGFRAGEKRLGKPGRQRNDDDEVAMLVAASWVKLWHD